LNLIDLGSAASSSNTASLVNETIPKQ